MYQHGSPFHAGVPERRGRERLLHGVHHTRVSGIDIRSEVAHEVVLGQPSEAVVVDAQVGQRWRRRALREERADRLALVETERGDVDQRRYR